jgi:hypothetical protein
MTANPNRRDGEIHPEVFYTFDDLDAKGYGDKTQTKARRWGVPVKKPGRRCGFMGRDFLKWIDSQNLEQVA